MCFVVFLRFLSSLLVPSIQNWSKTEAGVADLHAWTNHLVLVGNHLLLVGSSRKTFRPPRLAWSGRREWRRFRRYRADVKVKEGYLFFTVRVPQFLWGARNMWLWMCLFVFLIGFRLCRRFSSAASKQNRRRGVEMLTVCDVCVSGPSRETVSMISRCWDAHCKHLQVWGAPGVRVGWRWCCNTLHRFGYCMSIQSNINIAIIIIIIICYYPCILLTWYAVTRSL